jgi:hypothetical protein
MWSDLGLYNESLLVAREKLENWNWKFERVKRMVIQWHTTEYNKMRVQVSVGDNHGKLVAE